MNVIDKVFEDQAHKLGAMGLSDNAIDKALFLMAKGFLQESVKRQAEIQTQLNGEVAQLRAELQAAKDQIEAVKKDFGE